MIKRFCVAVLCVLLCGSAFAKVEITDQMMETFVALYPRYVELAKTNKLMPTQETVDQWGAQIEEGKFDAAKMQQPKENVDAFRAALEKELSAKGMTVQDFSELAAKVSIIYSNLTVEKATKELSAEEKQGMSAYTQQFDNALTSAGIAYDNGDIATVKKNMDRLDTLFNQTLAGM